MANVDIEKQSYEIGAAREANLEDVSVAVGGDDCSYEKSDESRACLELLRAAYESNNLVEANQLIETMVSKSLVNGLQKVHTACGYGLPELLEKYLLEEKLDPNSECSFNDLYSIAPVHFCAGIGPDALTNKRGECVRLLAKHGAKMSHLTSRQDTALHWATKLADLSVCQALVDHGVDINKVNLDNCTCAHGAAFYKNLDTLELLLDKKVDVNIKDISGKNILHLMCKETTAETEDKEKSVARVVCRLIDEFGMDVNEKDDSEFTPLMYACEHENLDLVDELVKRGALIDYTNSEGINAFLLAIINSCPRVVQKLISAGFNLQASGASLNCSYITDAAYLNDIAVLRVLIDAGCDVNETKEDENGVILNPLWAACERSNLAIVELLLSKGAQTVIRPDLNMTALHCAAMAQSESVNIARLLVEHNCPVNLKSTQAGETPLFLAINSGYSELVEFLLVEQKVDPNASSPLSRTVFQQAIFRDHRDIIRLLIDKGQYKLTEDDLNDLTLYIMDLYQDNDVEMISYFINTGLLTKERVLECIENYHKWYAKQIEAENRVEEENETREGGSDEKEKLIGNAAETALSPTDLRIDLDHHSRLIYPQTVAELDTYLATKMTLNEPGSLSDAE